MELQRTQSNDNKNNPSAFVFVPSEPDFSFDTSLASRANKQTLSQTNNDHSRMSSVPTPTNINNSFSTASNAGGSPAALRPNPSSAMGTAAAATGAPTVHIENITSDLDATALIARICDVAGNNCSLSEAYLRTSKFAAISDPTKMRQAVEQQFNSHWGADEQRVIVNAGARAGVRVPPGTYFVAARNQRCEIRIGTGERLTTQIVAGYTDVGAVGPNDGVTPELQPLIGAHGSFIVNVPIGKYAKIWSGQNPVLLREGTHVVHDLLFRAEPDFLVDIANERISHAFINILRVPPSKLAKIVLNNTPLLVPHRKDPYCFTSTLFAFNGFDDEGASYIEHPPLHRIRVPAGSVAKVWLGARPLLLEYRDSPYSFSDASFRAEKPLFVRSDQKLITHGSISRLRPGVDGRLEKAVILSDGEISFADRFTIVDCVESQVLGFIETGIRTLIFPSEEVRESRKRQNPGAKAIETNFETVQTSDSLKLSLKLVVAIQVTTPALCLSKLRITEIERHVEGLASSDIVRAVQSTTSQQFVNAVSAAGTDRSDTFGTMSVAEKVRRELSAHLLDCGITLIRFSIEEMKIDETIAAELSRSSLIAASANAEQAVLAQQAAIARSKAEVAAMSRRVEQEQQNEILVSQSRARLEAAKLQTEALLLEAEAKTKAQEMEGKILQRYPELLQLRLAEMQFTALRQSQVSIVSESLGSSPYALGAQGLWPTSSRSAATNNNNSNNDTATGNTASSSQKK